MELRLTLEAHGPDDNFVIAKCLEDIASQIQNTPLLDAKRTFDVLDVLTGKTIGEATLWKE